MSQNLQRACRHMIDTKAIDELEEMVDRDAFELWKNLKPDADAPARQRYRGAQELLTLIRNLGRT